MKVWYDILGREVKRQTSGFNNQMLTQTTAYDYKGNISTQTKPYYPGETPNTVTYQYDAYNRVTKVSNTTSNIQYTYTALSNGNYKTTTTNAAGQVTNKTQDPTAKVVSASDNGGQLSYNYDSWGNQLTVSNGSNAIITNAYDEYGRQTSLDDRNAGVTSYEYDAVGQLTKQTDARSKVFTLTYDDFGRLSTRDGAEGTTTYTYYSDPVTGLNNDNLLKVTGFSGEVTDFTYDNLSRLKTKTITNGGTTYIYQYEYGTYGNLVKTTYPSGVFINDIYDRNNTLLQTLLTDGGTTTTLFTGTAMNSAGIYIGYTYGNGKTSQIAYDLMTGVPTRYYTPGIQDLNFNFDAATGNLNYRKDAIKNLTKTFTYDNLNRLLTASVNGNQQFAIGYDGSTGNTKGNIISKTDAGNYMYDNSRINAVKYITNPAGAQTPPDVISTATQQLTYNSFGKTKSIDQDVYHLDLTYSADMERIKSVLKKNGSVAETRYFLGAMDIQIIGSTTRYIHYIKAGNGMCAIAVKENGVTSIYYTYTDYLGSILTLTNNTGAIVAKQNFDAWGRYRNPDNWTYNSIPTQPVWLYRGYAGHEHLTQFALINMNGRMYDPVIGRMLGG